jgi:hypothetical protein
VADTGLASPRRVHPPERVSQEVELLAVTHDYTILDSAFREARWAEAARGRAFRTELADRPLQGGLLHNTFGVTGRGPFRPRIDMSPGERAPFSPSARPFVADAVAKSLRRMVLTNVLRLNYRNVQSCVPRGETRRLGSRT